MYVGLHSLACGLRLPNPVDLQPNVAKIQRMLRELQVCRSGQNHEEQSRTIHT